MKQVLIVPMLVLACCAAPRLVVEAAQQQRPDVFPGYAEQTATTKPGEEDGERSSALTGPEISFPMRERRPLYRSCNNDVIEITSTFASEFNQAITMQPDGLIPLRAGGWTHPSRLQEAIRTTYLPLLHGLKVTLVVKAFESFSLVPTGQPALPGEYERHGDVTLIEALAVPGGFTATAMYKPVVLLRRGSNRGAPARVRRPAATTEEAGRLAQEQLRRLELQVFFPEWPGRQVASVWMDDRIGPIATSG